MTVVAPVDLAASQWLAAVRAARDGGFRFFDWLTAVDCSDVAQGALDVLVQLLDASQPGAIRVWQGRVRVPADGSLDSLTPVFPGAAWPERETYEMFGVRFAGFDDGTGRPLRRLLLPESFDGIPLRKSFVLAARGARPWPGAKDPGESGPAAGRRRGQAPGVPGPEWGPR